MTCSCSPGGRRRSTTTPKRVGRADRSVRNVRRDKEGFAFADGVIDDLVAFADAHFDVALELVEILFRIDLVKIVPRVWALDHHDKKIAPIIEVLVAHRRLEFIAVRFDPIIQINCGLHFCFHRVWISPSSNPLPECAQPFRQLARRSRFPSYQSESRFRFRKRAFSAQDDEEALGENETR